MSFGKSLKETNLGPRDGKKGEWYNYTLLEDQQQRFGRYKKIDEHDPIVYFDSAPTETYDETGSRWVIKDGEIGVPLQQINTFFRSTIEEVENYVKICNWYRQYLGKWVCVHSGITAIGKPCKVFPIVFHLLPYVSFFNKNKIITKGLEQVVRFNPSTTIEEITEKDLYNYIRMQKTKKTSNK